MKFSKYNKIPLLVLTVFFILAAFLFSSSTFTYAHDFPTNNSSECDSEHSFQAAPQPAAVSICKHFNSTTNFPSIINLVDDPLPEGRFTSLGKAVSNLAPFLLILGGMVAFLFLIIGGFRYMTAQGDPKAISAARGTITSAIIGLVLLASVFVIMTVIEIIFKINVIGNLASPTYAQVDIGKQFLFGGESVRDVFPDFGTLLGNIVNVALGLAGIVFFVMTLWGGIRYISARGDEKAISDARGTLTNAVIGLLIVIASFAIIKLVSIATGADISIF